MNILINASNLKVGGGLQVADSICKEIVNFQQHKFVVVLSSNLENTYNQIKGYSNVYAIKYNIKNSIETLFLGRDKTLDNIVRENNVECVLTIFGPSRWNPKVKHISGFARPHIVLTDSPFFIRLNFSKKWKYFITNLLLDFFFRRSTKYFYTENPYISNLLKKKWHRCRIETVTNFYHQVFDNPKGWTEHILPSFEGTSLLCVTANYPHKNLNIAIDIARLLKNIYPDFKFRFIFTVGEDQIIIPEEVKEKFLLIGKVEISECPSLYAQSNIMFQPTLLECFSATYPEAMKMGIPIVTTDLDFARGLCGDAALYYSPLSASDAAELIYKVATDKNIRKKLILAGKKQLSKFDTATQRSQKLISYCENIVKK